MTNDFKPFKKVMTKIENRKMDSSYEIYMALYQQLSGEDDLEIFKQFKPEFFDLIVVDECHRGSAREDSRWRKILDYFSSATKIGLTATPKETKEISNIDYFGKPIYTYSLKQGIDDGFLAPYKVIRVGINKDLEGYRPLIGEKDIYGNDIEDREYNQKDFDRTLIIDERTKLVAEKITDYFDDFDYIFGDYSYSKLRLKGFYDSQNKNCKKLNDISNLEAYIENNCAYGCRWFQIKKNK